jgi:hypothetical protein
MILLQCWKCRFYILNSYCIAYPKGIPKVILTGEHDHTTPYEGDNGIQFEKAEEP